MKRIVIIASTNGSVFRKLLQVANFDKRRFIVVSDRYCGAISFANEYGIENHVLESKSGEEFSKKLLNQFAETEDLYFFLFYTRILKGSFLAKFVGRVINFHPSLLPSFPGLHGFEDSINSSVKYVGSTVHLVDEGVDTGEILMQTVVNRNIYKNVDEIRHVLFLQQVYSFMQLIKWIDAYSSLRNIDSSICKDEENISMFSPVLDRDVFVQYKSEFITL